MSKQLIYIREKLKISIPLRINIIISTFTRTRRLLSMVSRRSSAGKGVLNNLISSFIFEKLNAAGVATHFVEKLSDT